MILIKKTLAAFLAVTVLSLGATLAEAQRPTYRGTNRAVRQLITRIETNTGLLRNTLNSQMRMNRANRVELSSLVQDLNSAVLQLRTRFDRGQSSVADAQEVLNRAARIDDAITVRNVRNAAVSNSWTNLRTDLDQLAIDLRGRDVPLASARAPQITFSADGIERVETTNSGRTIRARATISGDQLTVSSTGDRDNEFNVTFNPTDYGRKLQVTRSVSILGLSTPVVVQSIYNKTAEVAQFDSISPQGYPNDNSTNSDFILTNGEEVVAVLDNDLSSATAREGDRFTATLRLPSQYAGATVDGHVTNVRRSGRISGRSQMTLNFDNIRLRDGRSYRFAGLVESVRTSQGDIVRVDNEGSVRDDSQTTKTAERAARGTAVGAIIGAIAGGGKGAAIGAIVGAGGGAGSVYVQGRDDLDLTRGTEITIRATGPR